MGQRTNYAAKKGVRIRLIKEDFAVGMGQSANVAVAKVAQTMLREEGCALSMGHIAIQMMNLLHSEDLNSNRLLQVDLNLLLLLHLPSQVEEEAMFPGR